MKNLYLIILISFPTILFGQLSVELGYSKFKSDSGFSNSEETSYPGLFGHINYTEDILTFSVCADYCFNDTQNSGLPNETAIIVYRAGLKVNLEVFDFIYFSPGIKVGTYKIGYESISVDEVREGQLGYAIGGDLSIDVFGLFVLNFCVENNTLFKGKWSDGNPDPGFEGTFIRPGIIIYL